MKKWGIKKRVMFLAVMPAALIAALLAAVFIITGLRDLDSSLRERGMAIARQLAPASEYGVFAGNREILQSLAQSVMREADVKAVFIVDNRGKVLAVSGRPGVPAALLLSADARMQVLENGGSMMFSAPILQSQVEVDDFASSGFEAPASKERKLLGRVGVELSTQSTLERRQRLLAINLLVVLFGLVLANLLALRMGLTVTRPILRLADAVRRLADGRLDTRVGADSPGELGDLEEGVNIMAVNLKAAQENLQQRIEEATAQLSHQARHDALTGLVNRTEFETRLERALKSARDQKASHVMCYIDLDQFKVVNDTCGHEAGDELLRQLTLMLRQRLRERDTLARLGGDEFGLLLENCTVEDALRIAGDVRQMVREFRFAWRDRIFTVGASIGVTAITADSLSVASVMSAADSACYAAKDRGRDRVHLYRESDADIQRRQGEMQWVSRLTSALEEGRFELFSQPILSLEGDRLGYEVLLRLPEADGQIVEPLAFLPAAERYGLMPAIDRWVLEKAQALSKERTGVCHVNVSVATLRQGRLAGYLRESLKLYGMAPQRLCLEVTESAAVANLVEILPILQELREIGCSIALDNFGIGMTSFAHLKNLPVDYIKLDGSIVRDIPENPVDFKLVQALHDIAQAMGVQTIAEWVENEAVLEGLRRIGIDGVQGYWLGVPGPMTRDGD